MGRNILAGLMAMALAGLLLGALGMPAAPAAAAEASVTYYVSPSGDDAGGQGTEASPWRTIGYAVSRAAAGDTIKLMDDDNEATDDYVENVVVPKQVAIGRYDRTGPNPQVKALDGLKTVFSISADNVTVTGLDIYGTAFPSPSLTLEFCHGCRIEDNRVGWDSGHHGDGITITSGGEHRIKGNLFRCFDFWGIRLEDSHNNTISHNTLSDSGCGQGAAIFLSGRRNTVVRNTISQNLCCGIYHYGQDNAVYLNWLNDNVEGAIHGPWPDSVACGSGEPVTYSYNSVTHTGYLGNYYGDYMGTDGGGERRRAGDGVGDTDLPYSSLYATDNYPLVDASPAAYVLPGDAAPVAPPVADFYTTPTWGVALLTTVFSNQSTGEEIASCHWDFGDGQSSDHENPGLWSWLPGAAAGMSLVAVLSLGVRRIWTRRRPG